jgi:hypothetical protein
MGKMPPVVILRITILAAERAALAPLPSQHLHYRTAASAESMCGGLKSGLFLSDSLWKSLHFRRKGSTREKTGKNLKKRALFS